MHNEKDKSIKLPSPEDIHLAIQTYLKYAYDGAPPESTISLLPDEGNFDTGEWLMGEKIERDPPEAPLDEVRSAGCRLGNSFYPNMKLRLSRPPNHQSFIFSVDSHDEFLNVPPDSPDYSALEELKAQNASLANTIHSEWDQLSLPTERNFLRSKIQQAKCKTPPPSDKDRPATP